MSQVAVASHDRLVGLANCRESPLINSGGWLSGHQHRLEGEEIMNLEGGAYSDRVRRYAALRVTAR